MFDVKRSSLWKFTFILLRLYVRTNRVVYTTTLPSYFNTYSCQRFSSIEFNLLLIVHKSMSYKKPKCFYTRFFIAYVVNTIDFPVRSKRIRHFVSWLDRVQNVIVAHAFCSHRSNVKTSSVTHNTPHTNRPRTPRNKKTNKTYTYTTLSLYCFWFQLADDRRSRCKTR